MNREEVSQLSFDCVLPSAIFYNDNLEPNCIKFYAIARNLTRQNGYCFATNEYLATMMNADERSVKRWIKSLCSEGYLEVHTRKNGIQWQRQIYISEKFKKCLRRDNFITPPGQFCPPPQDNFVPHKEEYSNEEKKKEREGDTPKPPSSPFSSSKRSKKVEPKNEVAPGVFLTDTQVKDLLRRFEGNEDKLSAAYDKLSKWKIGKSIQGGMDYKSMTNWVIKAVEEDANKPKSVDKAKENEDAAKRIGEVYGFSKDINLGYNYIEFNFGGGANKHIKFTDNGFEDQVAQCLRRMLLAVDPIFKRRQTTSL